MKKLDYAVLIVPVIGVPLAIIDAIRAIRTIRKNIKELKECRSKMAETNEWIKGYLAGDKELAEYIKKNNPELYEQIMRA